MAGGKGDAEGLFVDFAMKGRGVGEGVAEVGDLLVLFSEGVGSVIIVCVRKLGLFEWGFRGLDGLPVVCPSVDEAFSCEFSHGRSTELCKDCKDGYFI